MSNPKFMVEVGVKLDDFKKGMDTISQNVQQLGQQITQVGQTLTKAITLPIAGMAAGSVKAFDTQIKAEARLRSALEANGRQVNDLFKDYKAFASGIQQITTVGDETTLGMLQVAEAMGLTGEEAKRAVKNAIAMQSAFGMNAQSAIRYTSALEQGDSVMLGRYIPALKQIEDESERTAYAQNVLAKAFGAATAEAQVGLGPVTQLKNNFGDLMEQIGELVSNAIAPMVERLNNLVLRLKELDAPTKAFYTGIALITAAIGPAFLALGALTSLFTFARLKFIAITVAIGAIVAGLIYVAKNFDWFRNEFIRIWNEIVNISIDAVSGVLDALSFLAQGLNTFGAAGFALSGMFQGLKNQLSGFTRDVEENSLSLMTYDEFIESMKETFAKLFGVISNGTDAEFEEWLNSTQQSIDDLTSSSLAFTDAFVQGMQDLIIEGKKLSDVLRDIGNMILRAGLKALIETGFASITGGAKTGGFLDAIFGKSATTGSAPVSASAMVPTMTGANLTVGGQFILRGPDLIATINKTNNTTLR